MQQTELIPHLFRTEYRKIVSVLCKYFGFEQIEIAEDIASDTFLTAAQTWAFGEIPPNPTAWLYYVAKNKAKNHLRRSHLFETKIVPSIGGTSADSIDDQIDLSVENIRDSQLQMMFAICHPSIPPESQIGLSLRILCGFGIEEIADAFLTNKETINKRLARAKEKIREEEITIEFPGPADIDQRLGNVLTTIYLLFSEGYYSTSHKHTIRRELCEEAIRLCNMLLESGTTSKPEVNALLALMFFHSSRFTARQGAGGEMILYEDQDTSQWDQELIAKGAYHLKQSSQGRKLSKYHLEASIAFWHTIKADTREKWENVLQLYNYLLQTDYSPIAALNRIFALSKVKDKPAAIIEAEKLQLTNSQFYFALLGELYTNIDNDRAKENFEKAWSLAKTETDKHLLKNKIKKLLSG